MDLNRARLDFGSDSNPRIRLLQGSTFLNTAVNYFKIFVQMTIPSSQQSRIEAESNSEESIVTSSVAPKKDAASLKGFSIAELLSNSKSTTKTFTSTPVPKMSNFVPAAPHSGELTFRDLDTPAENRIKAPLINYSSGVPGTHEDPMSFKYDNLSTNSQLLLRSNEKYDWLQCTRYKPPKLPSKLTILHSRRNIFENDCHTL